jgi:hypothetical protein
MTNLTRDSIPAELLSTYSMLRCAFPNGVDDDSYLPLIALLERGMGHRGLAHLVALFTQKDYARVLNDVYRVTTTHIPQPATLARVKEGLARCGYDEWLNAE